MGLAFPLLARDLIKRHHRRPDRGWHIDQILARDVTHRPDMGVGLGHISHDNLLKLVVELLAFLDVTLNRRTSQQIVDSGVRVALRV